jgi:hypothetical protein
MILCLLAFLATADLDALVSEIEKIHPNPYTVVTREAFHSAVADLQQRSASLKPYEVMAELSRIVAMIGDGHTRLTLPIDPKAGFFTGHTPTPLPSDPALRARHLPVRFFWFDDGLFIRDAADRQLIGAKVLRIGSDDVAIALEKMKPYVSADNETMKRMVVADYLAMPEMIAGAGIAPAVDRIDIVTDKGAVTLEPIPFGSPAPWLKRPDPRPFSFRYLPAERIVHFAYNEVANDTNESLADFASRMFRFIDRHAVEALVIDIRENPGGNGALNRFLLHSLIRCDKLQDAGRVFVLMGRRTFSAAIFFVLDLEQNTNAIFVGEPTGGKPNNFGESRKITLPNSGLTVRTSTLYWQPSDPRDKREAIVPDIAVPLTSAALQRDIAFDAVVEIVQAMRKRGTLAGRWSGTARFGFQRVPVSLENGEMTAKDIGKLKFDGRAGNRWMFGTIRSNGLRFPFFATRVVGRRSWVVGPYGQKAPTTYDGRPTTKSRRALDR